MEVPTILAILALAQVLDAQSKFVLIDKKWAITYDLSGLQAVLCGFGRIVREGNDLLVEASSVLRLVVCWKSLLPCHRWKPHETIVTSQMYAGESTSWGFRCCPLSLSFVAR